MDSDDELVAAMEAYERNGDATITFELKPERRRHVKKFRATQTEYRATFNHQGSRNHTAVTRAFHEGFGNALRNITRGMKNTDRIRLFMSSDRLQSSLNLPAIAVGAFDNEANAVEYILDCVGKILNSNEQFEMDDTFRLDVLHVDMPLGQGRKRRGAERYADFVKNKQTVISIHNKDELCCARALVTAKAKLEDQHLFDRLNKRGSIRQKLQTEMAESLHAVANVPQGPCGLPEIAKFQLALPQYQIVVIGAESNHTVIFKGEEQDQQLCLLHHENHYDVITSERIFLS